MATTTAPTQRKVEPATESDIPHLVNIWYDAFPSEKSRTMIPDKPGGRRWLSGTFEGFLAPRLGAGRDTKLLVSRDAEGTPAAFAIYHIWHAGSDRSQRSWGARWNSVDDNPDMNLETLRWFFHPVDVSQDFLLGERAHVHLELLATAPDHQKQGHGKALVEWGTALADELGIECYLDSSVVGRPLYGKHGYVAQDVSSLELARPVNPMVRPTGV